MKLINLRTLKFVSVIAFFALSTHAFCTPKLVLDKSDAVVLTDKSFSFYATVSDVNLDYLSNESVNVTCLNDFAKTVSISTHAIDYQSGYATFLIKMGSSVDTRGAIIYFPCTVSSKLNTNQAIIKVEDSATLPEKA